MINLNKRIFIQVLFLFLISFMSCKDDIPEFESPSIDILSYKVLSDHTCMLKIEVNKGAGAKLKQLYFEFKDITDTTAQVYNIDFPIQEASEYIDSFQIKIPASKHDYTVRAKLKSKKNIYASSSVLLRFSLNVNNVFTGINYIDLYKDEYKAVYVDNDIGNVVNRGEYFLIKIYYSKMPSSTGTYKLKLNNSIPIELETSFSGWMYDGDISWGVRVPADLSPGEYSIHIYADGTEYIAPSRLKVLSGTSSKVSIPDCQVLYSIGGYLSYEFNSSYLSGNKIYNFYRYPNHAVLAYDITKDTWETKKNVSYSEDYSPHSHFELKNVRYNNKQYLTEFLYDEKNYKFVGINIVEYDEVADTWKTITTYPGEAYDNFVQFVLGNCLYMGGGSNDGILDVKSDFWEYNFIENKWTKKKDIPESVNGRIIASCNSPSEGFIITNYRDFWKYLPDNDAWIRLPTLYFGPYERRTTTLVYGNDKVYLVGGLPIDHLDPDLNDICEYEISKGIWDFKYVSSSGIGDTPAFYYNDKILVGIKRIWNYTPYYTEIKP